MHERVVAARDGLGLTADAVPRGIGVDVEEVGRWREPGRIRPEAVFAPEELVHAEAGADRAERYAGLWCAKEAVFKAVAPQAAVSLRDIVILHDPDGAPRATVRGFEEVFAGRLLVSVSHTPLHAAAVAVCLDAPALPDPTEEEPA